MKKGETTPRTAGFRLSELEYSHCSLTSMVVWHTSIDLPASKTNLRTLTNRTDIYTLSWNKLQFSLGNLHIYLYPLLQVLLKHTKSLTVPGICWDLIPYHCWPYHEWLAFYWFFSKRNSQSSLSCASGLWQLQLGVYVGRDLGCLDSPNLQSCIKEYQLLNA